MTDDTIEGRSRAGVVAVMITICWAWVLWRPVSGGVILYPTLALLGALSVGYAWSRGVRLDRRLHLPIGLYLAAAFLAFVCGVLNDNPGLWHQSFVWFVSPALWLCWACSFTPGSVRLYVHTLVIMTIVVSGAITIYVASQVGLHPIQIPPNLLISQGAGFDDSGTATSIRFFGLSTLTAAGPFCASAALLPRDRWLPNRALLIVAATAAAAAALVSGRRSIALVIVLTPLLMLAIRRLTRGRGQPIRIPLWLAIPAPLLAGLLILGLRSPAGLVIRGVFGDATYTFLGIGQLSRGNQADAEVRTAQAAELLRAWSERPIFGAGLGAVLPDGFSRSQTRPWMFELQYHQAIYALGLVGITLLVWAFVAICRVVAVVGRAGLHQPLLIASVTAAVALLIANASNPYLQAVGHGWGIALAIGVMNMLLVDIAPASDQPGRVGAREQPEVSSQ